MKIRRRVVTSWIALVLAVAGIGASAVPVSAATAVVVSSAPCTVTGTYRSVTKTLADGASEQAHYSKCTSGGFTYLRPYCRIKAGENDQGVPPMVTFDECYIFVWTTGTPTTYVTRFGFADYGPIFIDTNYAWSAWYIPTAGYLKLSGYYVSTEICGHSAWWGTNARNDDIGCVQSTFGAP
jgi:hypothetical protein